MRSAILILTVLLCGAGGAARHGPEQVALKFRKMLNENNWKEVVSLISEESLAEVKQAYSFLSEIRDSSLRSRTLKSILGQDISVARMEKMTDEEFTLTVLRSGCGKRQHAGVRRAGDFSVIGTVEEGEDLAHVVGRSSFTFDGSGFEKIEVLSFRRAGKEWKVILSDDIRYSASLAKKIYNRRMERLR